MMDNTDRRLETASAALFESRIVKRNYENNAIRVYTD
jgi:hypothetical protein